MYEYDANTVRDAFRKGVVEAVNTIIQGWLHDDDQRENVHTVIDLQASVNHLIDQWIKEQKKL